MINEKEQIMYKYLFGPVPSRRLGMSLGVDLVPKKVCSLDCVYCEIGKTTKLTLDRKAYIKVNRVKEDLINYFNKNPDPDYITFSGSGEPTLNIFIDEILHFIKQNKPNVPVAVLTNGTLFYDSTVREAILNADVVLPSLDAATKEIFKKINRPAKDLSIDRYIQGLIDFRKEFKGIIWLEIFILPGYNDSDNELTELKKAILKIKPDSIQLNTLDRPGTISNLRGATRENLQRVSDYWKLDNVEIIAASPERKNIQTYRNDIETAIVETIARRPCTLDDLTKILGMHINEVNKYLDILEAEEKIETVKQERGIFYQIKERNEK
jgi:wyosine [tRNA(Phe)-imidazoG37] synthetase (radical SAM superfamily)